MAERTIHTCPTCKLPYLGTVCESCFESASEVEQSAFIKEYLKDFDQYHQDNPKKYAPTPGTASSFAAKKKPAPIVSASLPVSDYDDDDDDYEYVGRASDVSAIPKPKPTLKVFQIKVWRAGGPKTRSLSNVLVMLSTDSDTVFEQVEEEYSQSSYTIEVKELVGPFKSGFVLSSWDDA